MGLSIRDIATTILAMASLALFYLMNEEINLPLITNYRGAILALTLIGIGMCAIAGGAQGVNNTYTTLSTILGVTALILIIYGLITGAKIAFIGLTITIVSLWFISTLRHIVSSTK